MRRRGFSLIELTAVLLIAAIAAGAVALNLRGPVRRAQMRDVIEQVAAFDHLTRHFAREHDRPVRLVIDVSAGELSRTGGQNDEMLGEACVLPAGYRIGKLYVRGKGITVGRAAVACSRLGFMPTYAMCIEGPEDQVRWVLLAGLTGEVAEIDDEEQLRDILEAPARRDDAR